MYSLKLLSMVLLVFSVSCFKSDFKKELSENSNVDNLPVKTFDYLLAIKSEYDKIAQADQEIDFSELPEPQWFEKLITMAENQYREKTINQEDFIQILNLATYFCNIVGTEEYEPCFISALEKNSLMGSNASAVDYLITNSPGRILVFRMKPARTVWNMCLMVGHRECLSSLSKRFARWVDQSVMIENNILRSKLLLGEPTGTELNNIYKKANAAFKAKGDVFLLYSLAFFYRYSGDFKSCKRFSDIYVQKVGNGQVSNPGDAWKILNHAICQRGTKDYAGAIKSLNQIQSALANDAYFGSYYWQVESALNNLALGKPLQKLPAIDASVLMNKEDALLLNGFFTSINKQDGSILKEALYLFQEKNSKQSFSYIYFNNVYSFMKQMASSGGS